MLSNEMLSIKQHIREKDTYVSTTYFTFKNNVQTPTLEIKQKWPIEAINHSQLENIINNKVSKNNITMISREIGVEYEKRNLADKNNKIIEVRSFSGIPITTTDSFELSQTKRQCSSSKSNCHTTYNRRYYGREEQSSEKICSHRTHPDCTRTTEISPVSVMHYPYYVYSPYFVGVPTDAYNIYNTYYHPDVVNNLKIPTHKNHRKIKKPNIYEESYLDENNEFLDDEIDENHNKCNKDSNIYTIKYDENDDTEDTELLKKLKKGHIEVLDRDKFVKEVHNDLKGYYSDVIIKDCYCSISPQIKTKSIIMYITSYLFIFSLFILLF